MQRHHIIPSCHHITLPVITMQTSSQYRHYVITTQRHHIALSRHHITLSCHHNATSSEYGVITTQRHHYTALSQNNIIASHSPVITIQHHHVTLSCPAACKHKENAIVCMFIGHTVYFCQFNWPMYPDQLESMTRQLWLAWFSKY